MNALAKKDFEKFPLHIQVLLVEQEIEGNDKTSIEMVLETDIERTTLLAKLEKAQDATEIS